MNSGVVVIEQGSFDLQLFLQVGFKLCIDVLHYGLVAEEREERALSKHLLLGQHRSLNNTQEASWVLCTLWRQVLHLVPSLSNLPSLPTKCVFLLGALGAYYGQISKEMWWRPWTLSAHKAATLKKNLFCSLSHWDLNHWSDSTIENHQKQENVTMKSPPLFIP